MFRTLSTTLIGLGLVTAGSFAGAQVIKQTSAKNVATVLGLPGVNDYLYHGNTDSAGNRYIVGYDYDGSNNNFYVAKLTKKGFLSWKMFLPTDQTATGVATDTLGHVYAAITTNTDEGLVQLDANTGAINWTELAGFYGEAFDLAIRADGTPVTAVSSLFNGSSYNGGAIIWNTDGSGWHTWWYVNAASNMLSLAFDNAGGIYTAGYGLGADYFGSMMYIAPDFSTASTDSYDTAGTNEYLAKVAVDPVTQCAMGVGSSFTSSIGDGQPIVATYYCIFSGGVINPSSDYYPFGVYPNGAIGQTVTFDANGHAYMAVTSGTSTGPRQAGVYAMYEDPASPTSSYHAWDALVPATDTGTYNNAIDVTVGPNGPLLSTLGDLVLGLGHSAMNGVQVFSFSPDGAPIDRKFFGLPSIDTTAYYDAIPFLSPKVFYAGGYMTILNNNNAYQAYVMTGQWKAGPDDVYKADEDTPLTVGLAKSVLNNDGNQFRFDPLTAQIQGSSISAGIHSLTLNPDGTFSATFEPNFNGQAKFKYKLKQNGLVIATNQVKINVKPKNDAPTAVNDSFNVAMNSAVQNLNVLGNDSDIDGDNITIFSKTNNANATIGITPDKKFITFKPKNGFSGDLTFTYTIRDTAGLQSTATVSVHVS